MNFKVLNYAFLATYTNPNPKESSEANIKDQRINKEAQEASNTVKETIACRLKECQEFSPGFGTDLHRLLCLK